MKKAAIFFVLCLNACAFANNYSWCLANGGKIDLNLSKSCITYDTDETYYANKIYDILCVPYLSSVLRNKEVVFLKLIGEQEKINSKQSFLDIYNWKVTKGEFYKYI